MTTIACASDIHGMWDQIEYPKADFLVFAGDILKNYSYDRDQDAIDQVGELTKLNNHLFWLKDEGIYKEVIIVAGNHDFAFERLPKLARKQLSDVIYLQDEAITLGGSDGELIKFYGSPWQPWFYNWAFNFPNHKTMDYERMAHAALCTRMCWALIPDDTDVLITHGPPRDILDMCYDGTHPGCEHLKERLIKLPKLKAHIFGHIHFSYGQKKISRTQFVNAAVCGENYRPNNPIQVITI